MKSAFVVGVLLILLSGAASAEVLSSVRPAQQRISNPGASGPLVEYSIRSDGTARKQISDLGPQVGWSGLVETLSRSPDGSAFAIGVYPLGSLAVGFPASSPNMGLRSIASGLGVLNPDFNGSTPIFSPDGSWIAFTVGKCFSVEACSTDCQKDCVAAQVYVVRTDGTLAHEVAPNGTSPTWSADGNWLAYEGHVGNFSDGHYTGVYVARRDGEGRKRIADGSDPTFAPRGDLIAYRCGKASRGEASGGYGASRPSLCVVNRNGSGKRIVASPGLFASQSLWSPDAKRLAFVSLTGRGDGQEPDYFGRLFVVPVKGGTPRMVVREPRIHTPVAWSPDGGRIAFLAEATGDDITESVYIASLVTHKSSLLTSDVVSVNDLHWSFIGLLDYITFKDTMPGL